MHLLRLPVIRLVQNYASYDSCANGLERLIILCQLRRRHLCPHCPSCQSDALYEQYYAQLSFIK